MCNESILDNLDPNNLNEFLKKLYKCFIEGDENLKSKIIALYLSKVSNIRNKPSQSQLRKYYDYLLNAQKIKDENKRTIKIALLKPYVFYDSQRPATRGIRVLKGMIEEFVNRYLNTSTDKEKLLNDTLIFFESLVAYSKTK